MSEPFLADFDLHLITEGTHYCELAQQLVDYVHDMGFTHVEFLPVSEHPFDASLGYRCSDATVYGRSRQGNIGGAEVSPVPTLGRAYSLNMTVPPLGVVLFRSMQGGDSQ